MANLEVHHRSDASEEGSHYSVYTQWAGIKASSQHVASNRSRSKDNDSENVNEELVQPPAKHSKDIENVDQDKGVSGGVDEDRWAEEEAEEQAASKQPSGQPSVPEGVMAGQDDEEKQQVLDGAGDLDRKSVV